MVKIIFTTVSLLCGLYTFYALTRNLEDIQHPSEKTYLIKGSVSIVLGAVLGWLALEGQVIQFILM
ncbi:hypothetical protein [Bacillus sp. NPDC094106]|uniref:hypothetical protein n=1 Tax=Bacillus sp. NPDC094106 TaxID=3363949 RepID=UPI0037F2E04B